MRSQPQVQKQYGHEGKDRTAAWEYFWPELHQVDS
jgi:hypothetical protein